MKKTIAILSMLIITGCASYRPVVDMKGVDAARYETDLSECQAYAEQVDPAKEAVAGGLLGGAAGAAIGAILGAVVGDVGYGATLGAAALGSSGAAHGAAGGASGQIGIIKTCLSGRGYKVLR